ncbi:hypothetical protein [Kibdelosporangium phytohabitans]|uniref:Uncharacterized protein n=1 Tax=Kibdelosporangium phytohabitans TaxID=860235 RepID=A0A0N9HV39_9PSEU|nr:hypothetical protein [Kibdelosporangium phytohabitans]ALG05916.1 hypothetical protein AOZ06_02365 [Kibdelosporangium phytohabitans]MBE1466037.1 hypothetical protein [Kibdelosporangium phytohabitans]
MHALGFWLKVVAAMVAAFGLAGLGFDVENGYADGGSWTAFVLVEAVATGLALLGRRWHEAESVRWLDVADRPGTRRFRPSANARWLPRGAWLEFPDPLPEVPDVTGEPEIDIPDEGVPPDHTLRRLWLVRAQLAAHLDQPTARARRKFPGARTLAIASAGLGVAAVFVVGGSLDTTSERFVLGPTLACVFLLVPFTRALLAHTEGFALVAKRKRALQQAEARLMEMDSKRPGGPLGGPAAGAGEVPYTPPTVPPERLPS